MKSIKTFSGLFILMILGTTLTSVSSVQAGVSQIPLTASGDLMWAKGFGGTGNDGGFGIIMDGSGNSYTVGEFQNTVDFDPGVETTNLTSAGSTDGFISKIDSNGALVWVKQFGSTLADRVNGVKFDSDNNLYIIGYFRGTVDFDPGIGTSNKTSNGESDIFLLKLNSSGDFISIKSFGSTLYDEGVDLALDSSNNILLLSDFTGTVDFDPGAATYNLTSSGSTTFDIAVTKLDSNGDFIWAKSFGSTSEEYAGGIVVSTSGNIFITGNFDGTVDFNPNAGVFNLTSSFYDMFVTALDSNGQFLWAAIVGGSGIEEGNDIALDSADNIYVVGNFQNTVDFNPKGDNFYLSSNGQWDSYVLKLDQLGNFMWARALGSAEDDFALNITLDSNNNLYITGDFTSTVDFNPGTGTYNLTSAGGYDVYAVKLKSNGNFIWARSVGGSTNDLASGIALDSSNNNVHITGRFSSTADFDPGASTNNTTSIGGDDIFILNLQGTAPASPAQTPGSLDLTFDKDGLVTTSINSYTDQAYSVAIQTDGKILVAGGFSNPGYDDFFVLRYNSNGTLDTSFGTGGVAQTDFGGDDVAQTIKVQSDGKIIVAGYTSPNGAAADFALARYNSDGSLDTAFGTNGKTTTSITGSGYDAIADMAIQSDGKIIALGYANVGINNNGIVVVRYNTNGSLDTSFDIDGILSLNLSNSDDFGTSVAIQTDQKIIVGGTTFNGSNSDFAVIRLNSDGSLDTEFNTDGIATLDFGGQDWGGFLAIQPDEKITIGGSDGDYNYHIARLNGNGNLDLSFNTDGKTSTYLGVGYATVLDVSLQSNGKIILAGDTRNTSSTDYDFTIVRYNQDGSLDTTFGVNGMVFTDFGSFDADLGNAVTIQSDGKIVMAGYRHIDGSDHDLALARFIGDVPVAIITAITRTSTSPSSSSSIDFTVTFSKSVQNVDINDFSLTTTGGVTGASITGVTPVSASVYTVSVNTGSGDGTIRLDVPNTATIKDLANNDLSGLPFVSGEAYTIQKETGTKVLMGNVEKSSQTIPNNSTAFQEYANFAGGPVKIKNFDGDPIVLSERVLYSFGGVLESYYEMMAVPSQQLSTEYWYPYSTNVGVNTQIRVGNAGNATANVEVRIAGTLVGSYTIAPNSLGAYTYYNVVGGPVRVTSTNGVPIVSTQRFIFTKDGINPASFAETMGLPATQLGTEYWFPVYNNSTTNSELRIGNAGNSSATVDIYMGGVKQGATLSIAPNTTQLVSFAGLAAGPVRIVSTNAVPIVVTERVLYSFGGVLESYYEMLALPSQQLSTEYWYPYSTNVGVNTQIRVGNAGNATANVEVRIAGTLVGSYTIAPNSLGAYTYYNVVGGPVQVTSTNGVPITSTQRFIFTKDGINPTSFAETMGLPLEQLSDEYWFPVYNNSTTNSQLRIANP